VATKAYNRAHYLKNQARLREEALARYHAAPEASRARTKRWKRENPGSAHMSLRKRHLKREYNITPEEYDRMLVEQNGVCAICRQPERVKEKGKAPRLLCVDHCHKTNRIRKLLCQLCNVMIGMAQEDPMLLRVAADYLEKFS
jgi:hypothetical protein